MVDIFSAAYANDVRAIRAAIAQGQDPNKQHPRAGTIPLQLACQGNSLDAIVELLRLGADPNRQFSRLSRIDGRRFGSHTPIMYARSAEAAGLLLDAGAILDVRDDEGRAPLVWAIHRGDPVLFEFFLARGARTDVDVHFEGRSLSLLQFLERQRERVRDLGGAKAKQMLDDLQQIQSMLVRHLGRGDSAR